ncbi:MAG: outer membrane lipoprotein carrier protein LolA [Brumimicrobium sp.]
MKIIFTWIFVAVGVSTFAQKEMTASEIQSFKQKIESETQKISTIQTQFVQTKHLSFLSNEIESKGNMFLNSDGTLKWEYVSPNKYSIIFQDNAIFINDGGKKSSVKGQDVFKKINHLISGSISGKLFNDKEFKIQYFKDGSDIFVQLLPSDKALEKYIKEVHLYFPKSESTVSKVKLIEPSEDYTFIQFVNKKLNAPIDSSIFKH